MLDKILKKKAKEKSKDAYKDNPKFPKKKSPTSEMKEMGKC